MPNSKMVWASASRFKSDPQVAADILDALAEENDGLVTAEKVVDVARPTESPLHDDFEWDDKVAGQAWREETARKMMRSIVVITEPTEDKPAAPVRYFHNVITEEGRGYMPLARVLSSGELWGQVVADILRDLRNYRYKLASFEQFAPHIDQAFNVLEGFLIEAKE